MRPYLFSAFAPTLILALLGGAGAASWPWVTAAAESDPSRAEAGRPNEYLDGRGDTGTTMPVVSTWGDLLALPPIDLGGGATVRLGIEANTCPRWAGVLLYAYTKGFDPTEIGNANRDRLGPVWVAVTLDGESLDAKSKYGVIHRCHVWPRRDERLLFTRPVAVDRPGTYRVTVKTEEGKVLATAVVRGTEDPAAPFHPWSPLLLLEDSQYEQDKDRDVSLRTRPASATNLGRGIALPRVLGWCDRPVEGEGPARSARLPSLVPCREDPTVKLTVTADPLTLRLVPPPGSMTARPDLHLLARWWVNGVPYMPAQMDPIPEKGGGMLCRSDEDIVIRLKFDAGQIGAKKGDQIGLQLLYCAGGWLPVANPQLTEGGGSPLPVLTNRVSFTAP